MLCGFIRYVGMVLVVVDVLVWCDGNVLGFCCVLVG